MGEGTGEGGLLMGSVAGGRGPQGPKAAWLCIWAQDPQGQGGCAGIWSLPSESASSNAGPAWAQG